MSSDQEDRQETFKWTTAKTKQLIKKRAEYEHLFATKKRNSAQKAWKIIVNELGLDEQITIKQTAKKWDNLKKNTSSHATCTGCLMHVQPLMQCGNQRSIHNPLMQCGNQRSIHNPLMQCGNQRSIHNPLMQCRNQRSIHNPSCSAGTSATSSGPSAPVSKKRKRIDDAVSLLKEESTKEDERHSDMLQQNEKLMSLFQQMIDKM
ncbi:hypothetical protein WMY93_015731 [Mugilogobius chulae]|uniref:Myb-like domain-containing protein n=1 Tax=Mugilogobius chulae TaxID=88201 RepID=A0AAW0NVK0_9GOBI